MTFVAQIATTPKTTNVVYPSNSRHLCITSNGVLWMGYNNNPTGADAITFKYSTNNGATWNLGSGNQIDKTTGGDHRWCMFIDQDDYMHLFYFESGATPGGRYVRGTPNAGRTQYTWGSTTELVASTLAPDCSHPDMIAHRENHTGSGWVVHIVYYWFDAGLARDKVNYRRVILDAAGAPGLPGGSISSIFSDSNGTGHIRPTIDFNHTGDGKTIAGNAPHIWMAAIHRRASAGCGLRSLKFTYGSGPSWTNPGSVSIDADLRMATTGPQQDPYWMNAFWDGTRFVMTGVAIDESVIQAKWFIFDRNDADTTTTEKQKTLAIGMFNGAAGYDVAGNVIFIGQSVSEANGSRTQSYRIWNRTPNTVSGPFNIDTAAWDNFPIIRRGWHSTATRYDYMYAKNNIAPTSVNFGLVDINVAPTQASITYPYGMQGVPRNQAADFTWIFQDPDTGDTQSKFDIQYRLQGAASWTQVLNNVSTLPKWTAPALTFALGVLYEWQVRTYDAGGLASPWSNTATFQTLDAPADPVWVDPPTSGTINANPYTLVWDSSTAGLQQYQIQVVNPSGGAVEYDSGQVNSSNEFQSVTFPTNTVPRTLRVRVRKAGLWSAWVENTVNIAYNAPGNPTAITATWVDLAGLGKNHAFTVSVTHKTPAGSEPNVLKHDVWARPIGDTTAGLRIAKDLTPFASTTWLEPNLVPMEVRVYMYGDNAVNGYSSWVTVAGVGNINGFTVHDPIDPNGTIIHLPLNDAGAEENFTVEQTMVQFQGREFPVAEFGDSSSRAVVVPLVYSDSGQAEKIKKIIQRRSVLCYRDHAGRKVFGVAIAHTESDVYWGKKSKFEITAVDWTEGV